MRSLDPFETREALRAGRRMAKTVSEINNRTDHRRRCNIGTPGCVLEFSREFESAEGVGFPEIDSMTQPVVIVLAFLKRFAGEKPLSHVLIAPVVSEHESRRQAMQFLPVSFGDSSGGRVDPQFLKGFLCGFLGFCNFLEVFLTRLLEPVRVGVVQHPWAHDNHFSLRLFLFLAHPVTISFCAAGTPWRKAKSNTHS